MLDYETSLPIRLVTDGGPGIASSKLMIPMTLRTLLAIFSLTILLLTMPIFSYGRDALCGGTCGGGGSVIQFENQSTPFLLDRLTLNPSLARKQRTGQHPARLATYPAIETISADDESVRTEALLRVREWHNQFRASYHANAMLMEMLYYQLIATPMLRTGYEFNVIPSFELPRSLMKLNPTIATAVLFIPTKGVLISSPVWEVLDQETKVGLLIHETFRQLQKYYLITDFQMQMMTAMIMDKTPSVSTDFSPYFSPLLRMIVDRNVSSSGAKMATRLVYDMIGVEQFKEMQTLLSEDDALALESLVQIWLESGVLKQR